MPTPLSSQALLAEVIRVLEDMKAHRIVPLNVRDLTPLTDHMVVASGTSSRHVEAITDALVEQIKPQLQQVIPIDRDEDSEWSLVDLGDVIVHIMQPRTRDMYALEQLWARETREEQRAQR